MTDLRTVLAAIDLWDDSYEAIHQAYAWAVAQEARLVACTVLSESSLRPLFPHRAVAESVESGALAAEAGVLLAERLAALTGDVSERISVCVERGSVHEEILRVAEREEADLIVVGHRGKRGIRRLLLGSTAESIVRHARCSVLVARPSPRSGFVLAATDLTDPSFPALSAGATYARWRSGEVTALHCIQADAIYPIAASSFALAAPIAMERLRMRKQAEVALRNALQRLDVAATPLIEEGLPSNVIVSRAEALGAELVVVGTKGRTGLTRLALGSVAEGVVRSAPCSTLVARTKGAS